MNRSGFNINMPPVVKYLIIINVVMLLLTTILERSGINLTRYLGLFYFKSQYFYPHQYITHMFMHGGLMHLFMNMWMLWLFGRTLEVVWGSKRFLIYYFVTGLGAAALHTFVNWIEISHIEQAAKGVLNTLTPDTFTAFYNEYGRGLLNIPQATMDNFILGWEKMSNSPLLMNQAEDLVRAIVNVNMNIPTVGASGAIYGLLLAFGMLFPNTEFILLFPPIPIKAKYLVIVLGILALVMGVTGTGGNVAHFAHLGGMIFGYFLIIYWRKKSNRFY